MPSPRWLAVLLVAGLAPGGGADSHVKFIFKKSHSTNPRACATRDRCAKLCSRIYSVARTGTKLTLTPVVFQNCDGNCYVGTGTFAGKGTKSLIIFKPPPGSARNNTYTAVLEGDPKSGFTLSSAVPGAAAFSETDLDAPRCAADYIVAQGRDVVTEEYNGMTVDWSRVIPRDELLTRTGLKKLDPDVSASIQTMQSSKSPETFTPPVNYDVHTAHPECKPTIQDQGSCGSCWAYSTGGVLAQRLCLASDSVTNSLQISPQAIITCDTTCFHAFTGKRCTAQKPCSEAVKICQGGCGGGYTQFAFEYFRTLGATSETCVPYVSADGSNPIEGMCAAGTGDEAVQNQIKQCDVPEGTNTVFKATDTYSLTTEADIMYDVYTNGPVQVAIKVEMPLYGYTGGVFSCEGAEDDDGLHAVILTGWGEENGQKYWLLQNSWSSDWGDGGYFKLNRGGSSVETCSMLSLGVHTVTPATAGVVFNTTDPSGASAAMAVRFSGWAAQALLVLCVATSTWAAVPHD